MAKKYRRELLSIIGALGSCHGGWIFRDYCDIDVSDFGVSNITLKDIETYYKERLYTYWIEDHVEDWRDWIPDYQIDLVELLEIKEGKRSKEELSRFLNYKSEVLYYEEGVRSIAYNIQKEIEESIPYTTPYIDTYILGENENAECCAPLFEKCFVSKDIAAHKKALDIYEQLFEGNEGWDT